ncbi:substrate-binding domain-containing protein [Halobellus sp. EA9]|uniref:substrate-binding domain-containing protein n=1 Tax=Halobellus sp. EA9 TaxID=3421647 RepID=UPI003EB78C5B
MSQIDDSKETGAGRRDFLKTTGAVTAGAALLSGCLGGSGGSGTSTTEVVTPSESDPLTFSSFGGAFKTVLDEQLFQPFSEETGYPIESQPQGGTAEMLPKLQSAVQGGSAPVDVAIVTVPGLYRGRNSDIWMTWEESDFENLQYISDDLINTNDQGMIDGVGSMGWFINLVHNTEAVSEGPSSWTSLWDSAYEDQMAMMTPAVTGYMPDITAAVHFDGQETLSTEEGLNKVFQKLAEVKPQAQMWYTNEANFQSKLKDGSVPMGMLYNDITIVLQENGAPVESTFVEEGSVLGSGRWVSPKTSQKTEAIREFIDYASQPEVQDRIAENLYTVPAIESQYTTLSDETYERIAGPGIEEAIQPNFKMYVERQETINQMWNELIVQS